MLGAIIGDIVGSRFEFHNTDKYDFEMFTDETTAPGSLEEYKKNALLAEFEKDYEKASENWMIRLTDKGADFRARGGFITQWNNDRIKATYRWTVIAAIAAIIGALIQAYQVWLQPHIQ